MRKPLTPNQNSTTEQNFNNKVPTDVIVDRHFLYPK